MGKVTEGIRAAQRKGWVVRAVTETHMLLACPNYGCALNCRIKFGAKIPQCDPGISRDPRQVPVADYEELRVFLKQQRLDLGLSLPEVEDAVGLTDGHLNKMEKQSPDRNPQFETVAMWAQGLGYEIVLRPTELPRKTASLIEATRGQQDYRRRARKARGGA